MIKGFISYAREDHTLADILVKPLKRLLPLYCQVDWIWDDQNLLPSEEWDAEIKQKLEECNLAIFLVSNNFLTSDYIKNIEFIKLIERHSKSELTIIPILLAPSDFSLWEDLEKIQFFTAHGIDYGLPHQKTISYSDLVKHDAALGLLPNAHRDRFHTNLSKAICKSFTKNYGR